MRSRLVQCDQIIVHSGTFSHVTLWGRYLDLPSFDSSYLAPQGVKPGELLLCRPMAGTTTIRCLAWTVHSSARPLALDSLSVYFGLWKASRLIPRADYMTRALESPASTRQWRKRKKSVQKLYPAANAFRFCCALLCRPNKPGSAVKAKGDFAPGPWKNFTRVSLHLIVTNIEF